MRKALCVGIDFYAYTNPLGGCVNDALSVQNALKRHANGSKNFDVLPLHGIDNEQYVTKNMLKDAVKWLFEGDPEIALFYFAGHGSVDELGGYLCTSEIRRSDEGFSLGDLMTIVSASKAHNKIIILDSCHSGFLGNSAATPGFSTLPENTTILTACRDSETAAEECGHGLFTGLLVNALEGGAKNILGDVTPGSVYSYIDQSLGAWDQRPVFKANIKNFICLRKNEPEIQLTDLQKITTYFPSPKFQYKLDPTYEEDKNNTDNKEVNKDHEAIFALLRKYFQLGLVVPVDEKYMYWAAVNSRSCKLTALGQHYWRLVEKDRI